MAAAWYVGGQQGLDQIGRGGINQKILPRVGDTAPDFTVSDLLGNPVSLSDYAGKPIWLNFWGSWCPPCRAEMPDIEAAYSRLQSSGVVLLAVSLDESAYDAALFASRNHATFTVLSDPDRAGTSGHYGIANFPTHLFIGRDGVVERVVLSAMSVDEAVANGEAIAAT